MHHALRFSIAGFVRRAVCCQAWFMHMSMHARSPLLQNKGEELSVRLLLWATVLPTGARWSIDSWRRDRAIAAATGSDKAALLSSAAVRHTGSGPSFRAVASMGVFLQAFSLYYTCGLPPRVAQPQPSRSPPQPPPTKTFPFPGVGLISVSP